MKYRHKIKKISILLYMQISWPRSNVGPPPKKIPDTGSTVNELVSNEKKTKNFFFYITSQMYFFFRYKSRKSVFTSFFSLISSFTLFHFFTPPHHRLLNFCWFHKVSLGAREQIGGEENQFFYITVFFFNTGTHTQKFIHWPLSVSFRTPFSMQSLPPQYYAPYANAAAHYQPPPPHMMQQHQQSMAMNMSQLPPQQSAQPELNASGKPKRKQVKNACGK